MAVQNTDGVKYAEITDEIIPDIARGIELFVQTEAYWEKYADVSAVKRGAKTFEFRRLVKPLVRPEDVKASAEYVAPRPTKIAVQTFSKTLDIYRDKAIYSKEDVMYHFDDTVLNIKETLQEIVRQKKEFIYGTPFVSSACTISYDTSILNTLDKAAIVLRKNDAARWDGVHFLAHITPETLKQINAELRALGASLSEVKKGELDKNIVGTYGDWMFSVTTSEVLYKNSSTQYMVLMGKRKINGKSPINISKMTGESDLELINNELGSGVLIDEDGNYTSDDNKQQGSVAVNINGVGAAVNDDLCVLDCELTISEIAGSELNASSKTGYVSSSPYATVRLSAHTSDGTAVTLDPNETVFKKGSSTGATIDADELIVGDKYYVSVSDGETTAKTGTLVFVANVTNDFDILVA